MTDSEKLDLLLEKVTGHDKRFDAIDEHLGAFGKRLDVVEQRLEAVEQRLDVVEQRLDAVEERLDALSEDVSDIKLRIENELSHNIKLVAEGHMGLARKLSEINKNDNAFELMQVQISILESKVRDLEKRIPA